MTYLKKHFFFLILTKPRLLYTVLVDLLGQSNLNFKNFLNLKLFFADSIKIVEQVDL